MSDRRSFLKKFGVAGALSPMLACKVPAIVTVPMNTDQIDWAEVRRLFLTNQTKVVNFNTGSAGIMPLPILKAYKEAIDKLHSFAPYEVYHSYLKEITAAKESLRTYLGATGYSVSLMRNTTESINAVLHGLQWEKGDEILFSSVDYPYVKYSLNRLKEKYGIQPVEVDFDLRNITRNEILSLYEKGYSSKTKLAIFTLMTHKQGYLMPLSELCQQARNREVPILIDGAHGAGQVEHSVSMIGCDYYASSLHKWMSAPLGTGLLLVKNERLQQLKPPMSYPDDMPESHNQFTYTGTKAFENHMTLPAVMDFQSSLGINNKESRIKALRDHLVDGLQNIRGVEFACDPDITCGIVAFKIPGIQNRKLVSKFKDEFDIHIKYTSQKGFGMLRTSLNIHLDLNEVDKLLEAVDYYAKNS